MVFLGHGLFRMNMLLRGTIMEYKTHRYPQKMLQTGSLKYTKISEVHYLQLLK